MSITQAPSRFKSGSIGPVLQVISSLSELEEMANDWRNLEAVCSDELAYFQTYDWCRSWAMLVSAEAGVTQIRILAVRLGGTLVAVLPLMMSRGPGGVRILHNLGEPHSQYAGMVSDPVLFSADAADLVRQYLDNAPGSDVLRLDMVPERSRLAELANGAWRLDGNGNESSALQLQQFATSDDYLASFQGKKARNRARRRRCLEKAYGDVQLKEVWPGEPDFERVVRSCIELKKLWIANTGRISTGFALHSYADFLVNLPGGRNRREGIVALALVAGDREVAIEVSMIRQGHMYAYIGGFDWELRSLSPGKVQMEATVCWAIDNKIEAYDLLGNVADYKESWSNKACALNAYERTYTIKGWLYAQAWLHMTRPALKKLFMALPHGARKVLGSRLTPA